MFAVALLTSFAQAAPAAQAITVATTVVSSIRIYPEQPNRFSRRPALKGERGGGGGGREVVTRPRTLVRMGSDTVTPAHH